MKEKILLIASFFLFPFGSFSQTVEELIKETESFYYQKNYNEALQKLEESKTAIENTYISEVKSNLLPKNLNGFVTTENEGIEMSQSFIIGKRMQISRLYEKRAEKSENYIDEEHYQLKAFIAIAISNIPDKIYEISNAHTIIGEESLYSENVSLKPIKYKGYRAVIQFYDGTEQGRFAVIVGAAVLEITTDSEANEKSILEIADSIDIDKIIKYFGK